MSNRAKSKPDLTPQAVYEYACAFSNPHGSNWNCPTLKQVADHFRVPKIRIEEACQEYRGQGYLGVAPAIGGNGGYYSFRSRKDYLIEAYSND